MNHRSSSLYVVVTLSFVVALMISSSEGQLPLTVSNSLIQITVGGLTTFGGDNQYPSITNVIVEGELIMPPSLDGALYQMTSRSSEGNSYNPTQAGDCQGNPSTLSGYEINWVPFSSPGWLPGLLIGVTPRLYTGSYDYPVCSEGPLSPYYFNFGIALGSGDYIPAEVVLIAMTVQKTSADAQDLLGAGSEMPSSYWDGNTRPYAYYMPGNNYTWVQATVGGTNYVLSWPNMGTFQEFGYGVMVCSDAIETNPYATCASFYYIYGSTVSVSFRPITDYNLVLTTMVGTNTDWTITDTNVYSMYVLNVHGNPGTINAADRKSVV